MASSANFKHLQAQRINTFTLPVSNTSLTYYLQESESGSIIFVNHDVNNNITIYLPRLNGRSEDSGINFKFIFITSDGEADADNNNVIIKAVNDSISDTNLIFYSSEANSLKNQVTLSTIRNGTSIDIVTNGTYWFVSDASNAIAGASLTWASV